MDLQTACKVARSINSRRDIEGWTVGQIILAGYPDYWIEAACTRPDYKDYTFKSVEDWKKARKDVKAQQ